MLFEKMNLEGLWVISPQLVEDKRGFFARMVCEKEFEAHGLPNRWTQQNIAYNHRKGTLRGMHYQLGDSAEIKVVRCTQGSIYDVVVDLRKASPTYLRWTGVELSAENHKMFYIPEGFAHGYMTLTDHAEISYLVSAFYAPGAESGIRYNDPKVGIAWPMEPAVISDKDSSWPYLK